MSLSFVENTICSAVEQFLDPYFGKVEGLKDNHGIVFTVNVRYIFNGSERDGSKHHSKWEGRSSIYYHFLITASRNVFYACVCDENGKISIIGKKSH